MTHRVIIIINMKIIMTIIIIIIVIIIRLNTCNPSKQKSKQRRIESTDHDFRNTINTNK